MNVYPRKPLEAERDEHGWWLTITGDRVMQYVSEDDDEFAEHFMPAERLDTLLAAVTAVDDDMRVRGDGRTTTARLTELRAAFRAFREQQVTA